ncbi:MAG: exonuclease domain-containing protein, partial [Erysipelotrichaceae bacterium]
MEYNLQFILDKLQWDSAQRDPFAGATYEKPVYKEQEKRLELTMEVVNLLPLPLYEQFLHALRLYTQTSVELCMHIQNRNYPFYELSGYLKHLATQHAHYKVFDQVLPLVEGNTLRYKFGSEAHVQQAQIQVLGLTQALSHYGINVNIEVQKQVATTSAEVTLVKKSTPPPAPVAANTQDYRKFKPKKAQALDQFIPFSISEITEECHGIVIEGEIFEKDARTLKTGKEIQMLYVKDANDAILIKRFERHGLTKEMLNEIGKGDYVKAYGRVEYDTFSRELVFLPDAMEKVNKPQRSDNAPVKRVELHTHTKLSEMDGVSDVGEYISQAASWGMDAIAITDHMVVQSFPKAQGAVAKINKGREKPFKVIYGVEMNMVDPVLHIVTNPREQELHDAAYCVLDLETTGLSSQFDHIIEFGGQHIEHRALTKTLQFYVKPPVPISAFTTKLTGITQKDVDTGYSVEEAMQRLVDFIGDRIVIAHNASFDMSFINDTLIRLGKDPLSNPVIDTLDLSRWIHKDKKAHRLGNVARIYGITYDEEVAHRADYDTDVLAKVYLKMLANELKDVQTLPSLANLSDASCFNKVFKKHITVLAKNATGLKELFQLVTISHTQYLSYLNKNANNIVAEPRIIREELKKAHDNGNLLFGSSCANGELFELAQTRSKAALKEAMRFYDYIEIQPLESYRYLLDRGSIDSQERLVLILKSIIEVAQELGKIVVATGDAHYVHPEQKMIRDIYIQSQAIGGVRHPLYIYNQERRRATKS